MSDHQSLRRFRLLAAAAVGATFLLIVVGGIVRVSDSGLGCGPAGSGTEGWPLCGGRLVPLIETNMVVEYTHRFLAALVTALLVVIAWQAVRGLRSQTWLVRGSLVGVGLIVVQAVLGGLTVEHGLDEALVAIHLGLAMILLALLMALTWAARPDAPQAPAARGARGLAYAGSALVFATIVAGGVVAGTEKHGTPQHTEGAHEACGREFPTCNGDFLPFGSDSMVNIQLIHRSLMFLTVIAIVAFVVVAVRQGAAGRWPWLAAGLLVAQVLLGALNVWLEESAWLVVVHLAAGTLLWASMVASTLALLPLPESRAQAAIGAPSGAPAGG